MHKFIFGMKFWFSASRKWQVWIQWGAEELEGRMKKIIHCFWTQIEFLFMISNEEAILFCFSRPFLYYIFKGYCQIWTNLFWKYFYNLSWSNQRGNETLHTWLEINENLMMTRRSELFLSQTKSGEKCYFYLRIPLRRLFLYWQNGFVYWANIQSDKTMAVMRKPFMKTVCTANNKQIVSIKQP